MNAEDSIMIELARPQDAEEIQLVFYRTWLHTYPNAEIGVTSQDIEDRFKDKLTAEGVEKYKDRIKKQPDDQRMLVAKLNNKIVGACVLVRHTNNNELRAIYVLPEFQGKGVGMALWQQSLAFFDKEKDIVLEVATYNTKAIDFYTKLGFKDTGKRFRNERFRMKSGVVIPEMEMILKSGS